MIPIKGQTNTFRDEKNGAIIVLAPNRREEKRLKRKAKLAEQKEKQALQNRVEYLENELAILKDALENLVGNRGAI